MISCNGVRWIVGSGTYLDIAFHAWQQALPHEDIRCADITQNADYSFNTEMFSQIDSKADLVFIAINEKFGNFKRSELMQAALAKSLKLDSFVSPKALLSANVAVGVNCFIADGVIVGANTKIDYNTVLLAGAVVGFNVRIKPSCWIESGAQLGESVTVGSHAIIRTGAVVVPGVAVGRFAEIAIPGRYGNDIPAKTVFDPRFNAPIFVYGT